MTETPKNSDFMPESAELPSVLSISKSLISNFWSYERGEHCGIALRDIDILKIVESVPSDRMKVGHYFEYLCTGQKNRDGSTPEPVKTKTGKPDAMSVRMVEQSERFKRLKKKEGLVVYETGTVFEHYTDLYRVKGVLDIFGNLYGEDCIVDLKSSGLIGNQWEDYGWHSGAFNQRDKLTIQVVAYKWLAWKVKEIIDIPFYFVIHSTSNDVDSLFWRVDIDNYEYAMAEFELLCHDIYEKINECLEYGFDAYPTVKRCEGCELKSKCSFAIDTPPLETVVIDGIYRRR
jgi:hypothetical protein